MDAAEYFYVVGDADHRVHKLDRARRVVANFGRGYGEGGLIQVDMGLVVSLDRLPVSGPKSRVSDAVPTD